MDKNLAIILAGGTSSRMKGGLPKQFKIIAGKTILQHTVNTFENHPLIHSIFLVTPEEFINKTENIVMDSGWVKVKKILAGGETRQKSSYLGVSVADSGEFENVLIHDAVRPFISNKNINDLLEKLKTHEAVTLTIPSSDTIMRVDDNNLINEFVDRKNLHCVQTPQGFKIRLIIRAHDMAIENGINNAFDDCSLVLKFRLAPISVVLGSPLNIKITYPDDLHLAQKIIESKQIDKL